MNEIKNAKTLRFVFRVLFFIVAIVLPCILMITKYELTKEVTTTSNKITFYGFIIAFMMFTLFWKFKGKFMHWVQTWEYSYMKYFFIGLSKIWLYIVLAIIVVFTKVSINQAIQQTANNAALAVHNVYNMLEYCIIVIAICEAIAYLIFAPLEEKYDNQVKRFLRKQERKEDYKEAIKEIQEGEKE